MRTQEDNKKERKELKDWKKPNIIILNSTKIKSGGMGGFPEDTYTFGTQS